MFHYFRVLKNGKHFRGLSRVSVESFLSHNTKKIRRGTLLCFRNILASKMFCKIGESWFCRFYFLSHRIKTFWGRNLQCFTNLGYRKILSLKGVHHDFLFNFFCLTVLKIIVAELFCVSRLFLYQNFWIKGVSRFFNIFFVSQYRSFSRGTLKCITNFGYRKRLSTLGVYREFLLKVFCLTVPKRFVGEPFFFSETSWHQNCFAK